MDSHDFLQIVEQFYRTSIQLVSVQIQRLDNWNYSIMLRNMQIDQIVHFSIIVPIQINEIDKCEWEHFHTRRSASSRTRPAVSTQIKTFPSCRIVSRIVAKWTKKLRIFISLFYFESFSIYYLIIEHLSLFFALENISYLVHPLSTMLDD